MLGSWSSLKNGMELPYRTSEDLVVKEGILWVSE